MKSDSKKLDDLTKNVSLLQKQSDAVLVELVEMKHYMHEELTTKRELHGVKEELMSHIDGFVKKHETLDHEVASLKENTDRRLTRVEGHLGLPEI